MRPNPLAAIPLVASLVFALGGCDRTAPSPDPKPSATTPADEKVSIIRDDVGIDREPTAPMAPLAITIGFPDGGARLSDAAVTALTDALGSEQMKAGGPITLGGHTDSAGLDTANLRAATKRAGAVRDWLVTHGVAGDRIEVIAFGEQNPVAPNAGPDGMPDEAGRARNRRVEMKIAVPAGTPPAAAPSDSGTLVDELTGTAED